MSVVSECFYLRARMLPPACKHTVPRLPLSIVRRVFLLREVQDVSVHGSRPDTEAWCILCWLGALVPRAGREFDKGSESKETVVVAKQMAAIPGCGVVKPSKIVEVA